MISAGEFRNGMTVEYNNGIFQVIEFQHVKPGKGAAFVRTKLKNIETAIRSKLRVVLGLDAKISLVSPNTIQRFEGKAKRIRDLRNK